MQRNMQLIITHILYMLHVSGGDNRRREHKIKRALSVFFSSNIIYYIGPRVVSRYHLLKKPWT